jgi:CHAD domain-containing protein
MPNGNPPPRTPQQNVLTILRAAIDEQRAEVSVALQRCAAQPKAKRVHALRVATRRLQSVLELSAAVGAGPKAGLSRQLEQLLSTLSPLRDAHVARRTLEALPAEQVGGGKLAALVAKQERARKLKAKTRLSAFDTAYFERQVAAVTQALETNGAPAAAEGEIEAALRSKLARRGRKIERQRRAASAAHPKSLHRLRLTLKSYRYALDAIGPVLSPNAREVAHGIAALQAQLGTAHDAHALAKTARAFAKRHSSLKDLARSLERTSDAAQAASADAVSKAEAAWAT